MNVLKKCSHPGCNTFVSLGTTYCDKHESLHGWKPSGYDKLYNNTSWRKASKQFLQENPYCCICGMPATVVDHIQAHRGDLKKFWNEYNWQPLCKTCHDKKTRQEIAERNRRDRY